jgi:hypothetical protein
MQYITFPWYFRPSAAVLRLVCRLCVYTTSSMGAD